MIELDFFLSRVRGFLFRRSMMPVLAVLLAGCGAPSLPEPAVTVADLAGLSYGTPTEQFREPAGVRVAVSTARLDDEWIAVRGTFQPIEEGYHLYSKDMPPEGIEETGRPTLMTITGKEIIQAGALAADKEAHDFTQYGVTLPVYPEGPVTLYRLVRVAAGATEIPVTLTYMSCSSELCNQPVEGSVVSVALPQ